MKERLDVLLVQQGYATSREKAKAIIMAGQVYVDGQKEDKAGSMFKEEAKIEVRGNTLKYVSRGGLKLEKAMSHFAVTLEGKVCMDVGASTGGFTDCMLQNGAVKVYSVDVGHGQRAADYYRDYCQTHSLSFDNRVYLVMAFHDRDDALGEAALTEQESGVLLYYIFKDADALDRFRLGPNGLDIRYLRTAEGKSFYRYAEQFERGDANA